MCLNTVDSAPQRASVAVGYKIMRKTRRGWKPSIWTGFRTFKAGKWYKDWSWGSIKAGSGERYPKGFHIFLDDPIYYPIDSGERLVRVRGLDIRATGRDGLYAAAVVGKIIIEG